MGVFKWRRCSVVSSASAWTLSAVLSVTACSHGDVENGEVETRAASLIGAEPTDAFSGVVALAAYNGTERVGLCTGVIVAPDKVLSAAHCYDPFGPTGRLASSYWMVPGAEVPEQLADLPESAIRILEIRRHPDGGGLDKNDLAIVQLESPTTIPAMTLNQGTVPNPDAGLQVVGYGYDFFDLENRIIGEDGKKRSASAKLEAPEDLFDAGSLEPRFNEVFLSASATSAAQTCIGDSGAPLLEELGAELQVAAVASFRDPGCELFTGYAPVQQSFVDAAANFLDSEVVEPETVDGLVEVLRLRGPYELVVNGGAQSTIEKTAGDLQRENATHAIEIEAPSDATGVKQALLIARRTPLYERMHEETLLLEGASVPWTQSYEVEDSSTRRPWQVHVADVTETIEASLSGSTVLSGGTMRKTFEVSGSTESIIAFESVVLAVIFQMPEGAPEQTIHLAAGGSRETSARWSLPIPEDFDATKPRSAARLGLGIMGALQGQGDMPSGLKVTVNDSLLTSAAGGFEDGDRFHDLSIGGSGDSVANPDDPSAPPPTVEDGDITDAERLELSRFDDELYDLSPFIAENETTELSIQGERFGIAGGPSTHWFLAYAVFEHGETSQSGSGGEKVNPTIAEEPSSSCNTSSSGNMGFPTLLFAFLAIVTNRMTRRTKAKRKVFLP